ncbi:ATP-binding protein [Catalinimonas sp. 4WD22]|uniref:ATP-binding protein n=1 Tax=Catalinimonas locisalis TaxID=3133978 RepID=UPI00310157B4
MYYRYITESIIEALEDTPVIIINGARQTGKSTLCQQLLEQGVVKTQVVTFDDPTTLAAAQLDPLGFLKDLSEHVILDEIQRAPELLLSIKKQVDQDRKSRRFILTGSADVMSLPKVADSLAGRIEIHNLWPLSQGEILEKKSSFLRELTSEDGKFQVDHVLWKDIIESISVGGYPEAVARKNESRRAKWFESYMLSVLQKDIRDLANIEGLTQIPNVLQLLSTRVGSTLNMTDIGRLSGIKNTTIQRYMALLEHVFLVVKVQAWTPNLEGAFVKSPKVYLNDTGLLCHLRGEDSEGLLANRTGVGPLLENYVVMEILKQLSWSGQYLKPYHFSMHKGAEVDLVLENRKKQVFGIEIKSAASLKEKDFKGLKRLAELTGDKFQKGIVLYSGDQILGFGDNLYAVPIPALWQS